MKRTDRILIVLLPAFAVMSTFLLWGLGRLSAQVVYNDSAWQALDANGATWEHSFAEGIHSVPFLVPAWLILCVVVITLFAIGTTNRSQNNSVEANDAGAP